MSEAPRTQFASAALRIASLLQAQVHKTRLGQDPIRVVKVVEPDGPSTHGGKLARLSIVLAPESGQGQAVMCGWFDVGSNQAEMRSYESLAEYCKSRFGKPTDIQKEGYENLLQTVSAFLTLEGYTVATPKPAAQPAPAQAGASPAPTAAATSEAPSKMNGFVIGVAAVSFVLGLVGGAVIATLAG